MHCELEGHVRQILFEDEPVAGDAFLGLDHDQLPRRSAGAARAHRERRAEAGGQREPDHRLEQRLTLRHRLVIGLRQGGLALLREHR